VGSERPRKKKRARGQREPPVAIAGLLLPGYPGSGEPFQIERSRGQPQPALERCGLTDRGLFEILRVSDREVGPGSVSQRREASLSSQIGECLTARLTRKRGVGEP
jgi:hypothetical protein